MVLMSCYSNLQVRLDKKFAPSLSIERDTALRLHEGNRKCVVVVVTRDRRWYNLLFLLKKRIILLLSKSVHISQKKYAIGCHKSLS